MIFIRYRGSRAWGHTPWVTEYSSLDNGAKNIRVLRERVRAYVENEEGDGIRPIQFKILSKVPKGWLETRKKNALGRKWNAEKELKDLDYLEKSYHLQRPL